MRSVACLVVGLAVGGFIGCTTEPDPDLHARPFVEITSGPIEGGTGSYAIRIAWEGSDPDGFVDRFEYAVDPPAEFTEFEIEVSHAVTLSGAATIEVTGGTAPTDVTLVAGGAGPNGGALYAVQFTGAAPAGQWTKLTLGAQTEAGCEGTLTVWVAHQPLDINQDGCTDIVDASALGAEWDGDRRAALIDIDGSGDVTIGDASAFSAEWQAGAANTCLPVMP